MVSFRYAVAGVLLQLASTVAAHGGPAGHGDDGAEGMKMGAGNAAGYPGVADENWLSSYGGLEKHSRMILAHIVLMILAWFFILPIGVMFSIARSRHALPVQLVFLALNGVGVIVGTVYNVGTPDLYEKNAHHSIGWIATWVATAHVVMSLLFLYTGRTKSSQATAARETARFLPMSAENMAPFAESPVSPYHDYRWSGEGGHHADRSFSGTTQNSRDLSPTNHAHRLSKEEPARRKRHSLFGMGRVDLFLSKRIQTQFFARLLKATEMTYEMIDRTILVLGFIALATGVVTYSGIFKGHEVFGGLAHFIKGGIFFWYGLLTLGRWMGCFADFGWAWNLKPSRSEVGQWKAGIPSAEFTESFVIFLYGSTNVFLEHLGGWGGKWTAQDFEHVSIAIMFFGGGLCGMLVESKTIRKWLNTTVDLMPARTEVHPSQAQQLRRQPAQYNYSLNPLPGLVILMLGLMMSGHQQSSMVSTKVHAQWGGLLAGFSLARGVTYITLYLSPPTSIYPSRPPSELVSAFCLISGGLVFMGSAADVIRWMEASNIMAMVTLTVVVGFTAFLMAYAILVLSLKGWAVRRELKLGGASKF
ncbi:hypothetical protein DV737_g801, partial [Chaetothyriales sp. CBS 132003]